MKMKRLLILQNEISSYNVPFFNELSRYFETTVGFYLRDKSNYKCLFKKKCFEYRKIKGFTFVKGVKETCSTFDVIIYQSNPNIPSYSFLPFMGLKAKLITWGIGFRCSYVHPYQPNRKHTVYDFIAGKLSNLADANLFYMEKSKEFWKGTFFDFKKIFVAPNTTEVATIDIVPDIKRNILFVGTLYPGKGLDLLLNSFREAIKEKTTRTKLIIVGDGVMKDELQQYVEENDLREFVDFTGPIYDEKLLGIQFQNALLCVSPTQGGLTCPKSMGYGVPFVCRKDAITGGEIYHMTPGVNGIMYEKDEDLTRILIDAIDNPEKYIRMGLKAKEYYDNNATIKHMAQGAINAINYVLNK